MSLIDSPNGVHLTSFDAVLETPGVRVFESNYGNTEQILASGFSHWSGSMTWGPFSRANSADKAKEVEASLIALAGGENYMEVSIPVKDQDGFFTVTSVNVTAQDREGVQNQLTFSAAGTIVRGAWLQIGHRAYRAVTNQVNTTTVIVTPGDVEVTLPAALEWVAPVIRVRQRGELNPRMANTPDFYGPYRLEWVEHL